MPAHRKDENFKEIPRFKETFERELAEVDARLRALRELQPLSDRCHSLQQKEVPELQQRVRSLEADLERAVDQLDAATADATEAQHALQVPILFSAAVRLLNGE